MSPDELSLKNGDLVYLDARVDKEWLRGHTQSGKSGIFPVSVVEIVVGGVYGGFLYAVI